MDIFHVAQAAEVAAEANNQGVAQLLGINLKLFIAQLVNFGIVILILWKWVFTPITRRLEQRTQKIERSLQDAETTTKERAEFEQWKNQSMAEARTEAAEVVHSATKEAEQVRADMLAKTREEQEKLFTLSKAQLENEKIKALAEAKGQLTELVIMAAEKILSEKLDSKKDKELIDQAMKQIKPKV